MSHDDVIDCSVQFVSDNKGYFDRKCPNPECGYIFKINPTDWVEKVSDEEVHCPLCGFIDKSYNWNTLNQEEEIKKIAIGLTLNHFLEKVGQTFSKTANAFKDSRFLKFEYNPGRKLSFINNPIGQLPEWEKDIICNRCGTRYSVRGIAYFCPCCGHFAVEDIFDETLKSLVKMLESIEEIRYWFEQKYDSDAAETMSRSSIEGSLGDVISAFQKYAEATFTSRSKKQVRPNDFQIVQKGSALYKDEFGFGYDKWLNSSEIEFMELMFQRRHILEHNSGLVDEMYLKKSKDSTYKIGQRVLVKPDEVKQLIDIMIRLSDGLKTIVIREVEQPFTSYLQQ